MRARHLALVALALGCAEAKAEAPRAPLPPAYVEECGSCHLAYPARFLGARSWAAVMTGLGDHFGVDASLEPALARELAAFLRAGARSRETLADGAPVKRIRDASWFRAEHPRPESPTWRLASVRSPANCAACHREAELGRYGERSLRIPREGDVR